MENKKIFPARLFLLPCSIFILFCIFCPRNAQAQAVSSQELIEKASAYDGREVVYRGELIGAVLGRGAHVWLNLNDGNNAIGAWVDRSLTGGIKFAGGYMVRGDVVVARGIFHRSCSEHGGGIDIHASELNIVTPGGPLIQGVAGYKIILLVVLLGVLACLLTAHILLKRFRKN